MATNKEVCEETLRKTYNNIDCKDQLIYLEVVKSKFAGYRRELLINSLSELEVDFYVCTECKGVMRNACLIGEEQNLVCEGCVTEGVTSQSMVKSRKKILELQAKCPLATRDCNWNGTLAGVEEHINVCEKCVVKCKNACDVILPRRDLDSHLKQSCVKRRVKCEHCNKFFVYEKLLKHYQKCLEYQVPCPKNCGENVKRKLIDSHLELECPNMVVVCPYKKFGCELTLLRCELEEHRKTNQIQHLEHTSLFGIREMEELKQSTRQQTETNRQLTETNRELTERLITLENLVGKYPIILRNGTFVPLASPPSVGYTPFRYTAKMKSLTICLTCTYRENTVSVSIEYDDTSTPLTNPPFEGRFKLSMIDRIDRENSLVYESEFVKLQPLNVPKDKREYPSEFVLAEIPYKDLQKDRFRRGLMVNFTLQIQEIEDRFSFERNYSQKYQY